MRTGTIKFGTALGARKAEGLELMLLGLGLRMNP